jgi:hypothetical protein
VATDFVEGVRGALASWLTSQLASSFPGLEVMAQWPSPGRMLPPYALTVLAIDAPRVEEFPPRVYHTEFTGPGALGNVTYAYGYAELDLQLDLWAHSPKGRDLLQRATSDALNTHPIYSLPVAGALPQLRRFPGCARYLTSLGNAICSYQFDAVTPPHEGTDAVQAAEWRASFAGTASFYVTTTEQLALLRRILLTLDVNGGPPETTTITP